MKNIRTISILETVELDEVLPKPDEHWLKRIAEELKLALQKGIEQAKTWIQRVWNNIKGYGSEWINSVRNVIMTNTKSPEKEELLQVLESMERGEKLLESRSYEEYIQKKKAEYGEKFSDEELNKDFIPYFENGERISVDLGDGEVKQGTIGVTTGWKPVFLLMSRTTAFSSSTTIGKQAKVVQRMSAKRYSGSR